MKQRLTGHSDPSETHHDEATVEADTPKLLALPNEIQAMIYELAAVELWPIELRAGVAILDARPRLWRLETSVHSKTSTTRPSVLTACKYLRSFVAPIYFSVNMFLIRVSPNVHLIRQVWGEDVRHIRIIMSMAQNTLVFRTSQGQAVSVQWVPIYTNMRVLPDGTLVIKRDCWAHRSGTLPHSIELCKCLLDKVAAHSSATTRDSRRMFEVLAVCIRDNLKAFGVEMCETCRKPCLVEMEKRRREG